ncbi:MAG: InlB B-repeat-containing protein [Clostridium sp.]|uniref:InlB B-repeat-containing protein n=1 Tax=Clostridium sp. TaxID=1506 RepID=UPI0030490073
MNKSVFKKTVAMVLTTSLILGSNFGVIKAYGETLPGVRHVSNGNDVFLGGNFIEVGVNKHGSFGTAGNAPSGFSTTSQLGMRADGDGFNVGMPSNTGDFFLPGDPYESYVVGYKDDKGVITTAQVAERKDVLGITNISTSDTSSGNTLSATTVGITNDGKLEITQVVSFDVNDKYFNVDVTYRNLSDVTIYDARYLRSVDPDQDRETKGTHDTKNSVVKNPPKDEMAMVIAKGGVTNEPFIYMAWDSRARASVTRTTNPYSLDCYNSDIVAETTADAWIAMTFAIGDIAPGASVSLDFKNSLNPDINAALPEPGKSGIVTFKDYDGTIIGTPQTIEYGKSAVAPTEPARLGYHFVGWDKAFDNIAGDLTVTAMYGVNNYTVTFKDYDGTVIETAQTINYGSAATAPKSPTRVGYTFVGWDKAFNNIVGDLTVTAMYGVNNYTVTFKDYDGTVIETAQTINYGSAATAPKSPTRVGYTFIGWDKDFNNISSDLTVTAKYEINKYTATFKDYDGTTIGMPQNIDYGSDAIAPKSPTRVGYTFIGWDKDFNNITGDLTVTAKYEINTYTVTFKDYDGTVIGNQQKIDYGKAATSPKSPTRVGYKFVGWDKTFDNISDDLTVTAKYEINQYTVTFKDYDGTVIGIPQSIDYGKAAKAPKNPIRIGYKFSAWDKSFDNITEDLVVTASYTTGITYVMPVIDIDSNTKEVKSLIGYLTSGKNTIVVNTEVANLIIPANVVNISDLEGVDYLKTVQKIKDEISKKPLIEKLPSDISPVGNIIDFNLQLFDSKDKLIKDIHEFANNQKVRISIKLTSDDLKNVDTDNLSMYYYDEKEKQWIELGGSFDKTTMEFSYDTSHFSTFAVMEKQKSSLQEPVLPQTGSLISANDLAALGGAIMLTGATLMRRKSKDKKDKDINM